MYAFFKGFIRGVICTLTLFAPAPFLKTSKDDVPSGNFIMIDGWIHHRVTITDRKNDKLGMKDIHAERVDMNNGDNFEGTIEREGNRYFLHIEVGWMGCKGTKFIYVPVNSLIRRK